MDNILNNLLDLYWVMNDIIVFREWVINKRFSSVRRCILLVLYKRQRRFAKEIVRRRKAMFFSPGKFHKI